MLSIWTKFNFCRPVKSKGALFLEPKNVRLPLILINLQICHGLAKEGVIHSYDALFNIIRQNTHLSSLDILATESDDSKTCVRDHLY